MRHYHHDPEQWQRYRQHHKGDKMFFGLIIIAIGVIWIFKKLGLFFFDWHTFWPVILIIIGLGIGIRKKFRNNLWWILILIGVAHTIPEFEIVRGVWSNELMVPFAFVIGGIFLLFRAGKKNKPFDKFEVVTTNENALNIDVTFGGRKEIVTSKDFKGGNIHTTFGGVEVNMIQADCTQPIVMNIKVSFGGVELIVPSHWELQNEIEPTFGSVEDHRSVRTAQSLNEEKKILVLKGHCSFGSIEIKSY